MAACRRRLAAAWPAAALLLAAPAAAQDPPPPPEPPALVAPPAPAPAEEPLGTISAALLRFDEATRVWTATGNVEIRYRQYTLRGDTGEYDEASETATLSGGVTLDTGENLILGGPDSVLTFRFSDRTWSFTRATTELRLSGLLSPVYISAGALSGTRQTITLNNVRVTTCPPDQPQYELGAREVTLIPNRRIIARRATATLFGVRLWTLPAVSLPIRREEADRSPIMPEVGQSTEEGLYVKTNLHYAPGGGHSGVVRADLMQKRGLGLGLRHEYDVGGAEGQLALYSAGGLKEIGAGNFSANLRHRQQVLGFDTTLQGELRRNAYQYLPDTTSRNATLSMARSAGSSDTQISLRYDATRGSSIPYRHTTASLAQTYRYNRRGTVRLNLDAARQSSPSFRSSEVTTAVDVAQGFDAADAQLTVNHITMSGPDSGFVFRPVQRLPELTLRSDARRLGLTRSDAPPVRFQVSSGRIEANNRESGRQVFQADVPTRSLRAGSARVEVGGGFRQAVYDGDAAQYSVSASARITQPIGRGSDVAIAYSVQAPRGYTPFQFDRPFAYNTLTGSVRVAESPGLEVRVGTGYDFRNDITPWRDLLGYVRYEPSPRLRLTTNVAVNVNGRDPGQSSSVRYINNSLRLRLGRFHFDGESRYLPSTGRFGRLLGNLSTPIGKRWSVRALVGTASGQRYRRLMVARDMGCVEGYVAAVDDRGWRNERGVRVMLRIKAFPMAEPFSAGMFGENLDIGAPDATYGGVADGPLSPMF